MLTVQINPIALDKQIILESGIMSLTETLTNTDQKLYSRPAITVSGLVVSGIATDIQLDLKLSETYAEGLLTFLNIPEAYSTLTISGITYTFIPNASGYNADHQIKLGTTTFGTSLNTHRVLNNLGVAGTDYNTGQTINPFARTAFASNPLVIRALTYGTSGNSIGITTTSSGIVLSFDKLYNGGITYPTSVYVQNLTWSGVGTYLYDPVTYSPLGIEYEGTVKLFNNDEQLVNVSGIAVEYTLTKAKFYGKTTLDEFIEVPNLSGIWESNGYADSSGQFYITWSDPAMTYSGVTSLISAPGTTGTPTQTTRTVSTIDSIQPIEYNIFVYTGSTAPERNWPRPVDANGTWYWAGRTSKTYAQVNVPSNTKGIWVGYGNKYTYATTVTDINQTSAGVYLM